MLYAIGDVHGCFKEMQAMLDKISPTKDDQVWFIGDIIDRGPESANCLKWAVDEAPENVHFLLGNHEDMANCVIARDPEEMTIRGWTPWFINGGDETSDDLYETTTPQWRREKLVPWIASLIPYTIAQTDAGQDIALVHAGFDPRAWNKTARFWCDSNDDPMSNHEEYEIGHNIGTQYGQYMVWARKGWYDTDIQPEIPTVYGHTPVVYLHGEKEEYYAFTNDVPDWIKTLPEKPDQIWHNRNIHDIDCGCVFRTRRSGAGKLAALRLDDMEEFYI